MKVGGKLFSFEGDSLQTSAAGVSVSIMEGFCLSVRRRFYSPFAFVFPEHRGNQNPLRVFALLL